MTKFGDYINQKIVEHHQAQQAWRSQAERDAALLPPDLTGQVYLACRAEAARVRDRVITLEAAIDELRPQLAAARENERAAYVPVYYRRAREPRYDILFGEMGSQPAAKRYTDGGSMRGAEAIKVHQQQVQPLQRLLRLYEMELAGRQQELSELRKIAEAAGEGSVTLIHRLSAKWRSRLGIGQGIRARLVSHTPVYCDLAGNPLPPEAIRDGFPDLPAAGRVQEPGGLVIG